MTKKENFIELVEKLLENVSVDEQYNEGLEYFEVFKNAAAEPDKPRFTENGKKILEWLQANADASGNMLTAKVIGEGMGISSRTASSSIRKLVSDGFVDKIPGSPIVYSITDLGRNEKFDVE